MSRWRPTSIFTSECLLSSRWQRERCLDLLWIWTCSSLEFRPLPFILSFLELRLLPFLELFGVFCWSKSKANHKGLNTNFKSSSKLKFFKRFLTIFFKYNEKRVCSCILQYFLQYIKTCFYNIYFSSLIFRKTKTKNVKKFRIFYDPGSEFLMC